jgi:hypothetical protein
MKTISSWLAVAALLAGMTFTAAAQSQTPAPAVDRSCFALEGTSDYYFGEIDQSATVEHTFVFKNGCSETVEIEAARASCGCTAAVLSEKVVPPGGTAKIQVKFTPPRGTRGRTTKTVSVYLKGDPQPHTVIRFSAQVKTDVDIQPSYIQLMGAEVGKEVTGTSMVKNVSDKEVKVSEVSINMTAYVDTTGTGNVVAIPFNGATVSPAEFMLKPNESKEITVRLTPNVKGQVNGAIRLKTGESEGIIQVFGLVRDNTPDLRNPNSGQILNSDKPNKK